ncbi:MAG: glycogen synthase [Candidatus Wildermuthbacteria bacterium]|nr:glycogen synthase [Candidatus Wildermuthbacteria bacterium]
MANNNQKKGNSSHKQLKVLFVVSEAYPYASVGGLGMAIFSLTRALKKEGLDVRIFMPKYGQIDEKKYRLKMLLEGLQVPTDDPAEGKESLVCNVKQYAKRKSDPMVYFLENMEYYEKRSNVYGYSDDPIRFVLLSRGALEFLRQSDWVPDVINCADWHTGALPNYLKTSYSNDPVLGGIKTVFSIHNLYHQGVFDHRFVSELDADDGRSPIASFFAERLLKQNFVKRGILYSDLVNTVSETYAKEILTKEYGEGLEDLLQEVRTKVFGILNGLDHKELNPATDPSLVKNFTIRNLKDRVENKLHLQKEFNLDMGEDIPVLGMVGRLYEQKGIDLLFPILEVLLAEHMIEFVVVGGGEPEYRTFFEELNKKFPHRVGTHLMSDVTLARHVFAGSDLFLMPSKFEPCGITQMEAMRYGAIPVVRETGGLADTVENFDPIRNTGTGFTFEEFHSYAFFGAIVRGLETYKYKKTWERLVRRAMKADFSWNTSAKRYIELYQRACTL